MPLQGETIRLRELRREDYPLLVRLRNDLDTQGWSRTLPPDYTVGMYEQRFDGRPFEYRREWAIFVIEAVESGEAVGFCSYSNLRDRHDADIGIAVERSHWGSGAAEEATELLCWFLFVELGLQVVRLSTQSGNPRAVAAAERAGFREAVRFREAVFKAGSYHDNLEMDLLREEWYARHPELTDGLADG